LTAKPHGNVNEAMKAPGLVLSSWALTVIAETSYCVARRPVSAFGTFRSDFR
jgi:hypothetical protein